MTKKNSFITVTDQFCGAGGNSVGAIQAGAEVKLALNHWPLAIETHNTNFPDTLHDCTDISACNPRRYPSTQMLVTGPECTNHSGAKGKRWAAAQLDLFGKVSIDPAEERSRATMWDVPRFAEYHDYNFVIVENVVEARRWRLFDAWIQAMRLLDYNYEIVYYNSMFAHPTPQSRDRMYVVFFKKGNKVPDLKFEPVAFCDNCGCDVQSLQSWKQPHKLRWGRYRRQYVYRCPGCTVEVTPFYYAALNCIDWAITAERIGDRKRPLKPKTLDRIRYGLEAYGNMSLIFSGFGDDTEMPMPIMVEMVYSFGGGIKRSRPGVFPASTQTSCQSVALVMPGFLSKQYSGKQSHYVGLDRPTGTITTVDHHALVQMAPFIAELRNNSKARPLDHPLSTVTTTGSHHALVGPAFLSYYYGSNQASNIAEPVGTVTTRDRAALVQATPRLEDCTFRMLQPHEIGLAMAFPSDYVVLGTKRQQVKQYGNAVTPPVMRMIIERCIATLN